jgi:hypothetical protein
MITSYSKKEIDSLMLVVSTEIGLRTEVSSTMMTRLSLHGLMKRINSELFPCNQELTSNKYSKDLLMLKPKLRRLLNSHMMTISVTSLPAQPILELQ